MIVKAAELPRKKVDVQLARVLHLINGEHFAGAERVQDLLAMALPDFGYQADFACLKPGKFADIRRSETQLFELNMKSSFDLLVANRVKKIVREGGYQILHAHTPRTLMIATIVSWQLKLPLVYHVHSPVGRDSTRQLRNKINTWFETQCLRQVNQMICVSKSLKGYMSELGHDAGKLQVVHNGVPVCLNSPTKKQPQDRWVLGTMALYRPRKGIECLLEAMAILKQQNVNACLRAVGGFETPEYETEVKNLARQLNVEDIVTWTGFQTDINAQFQQMDLFVLPSLFGEGLPMVVLESMAQAVPVIASDVEGIPEAVRDGQDGLIFEPASPSDLADKVSSLVGDNERWNQMSRNAWQRQRDELSDLSMARGVAVVYKNILKELS